MISTIRLRNFKCFRSLELGCSPLTLLCGLNGAGKSSVIQALLLVRQSFESGELERGRLHLNGPWVDLGTGRDVFSEDAATSDSLSIGFTGSAGDEFSGEFAYANVGNVLKSRAGPRVTDEMRAVPPLGGDFAYLEAERVGPRKLFPLSASEAERGTLGRSGDLTWNLLAGGRHTLAKADPRRATADRRPLTDVVDHWLQAISPGARLGFEMIRDADAIVGRFAFDRAADVPTRSYRTTHVGFGLSYALPVIVALLVPAKALVLIENPEAHLHPCGQTRLAELAVRAALAGVQVIVETHSDHFMDGVRIAVARGLIARDQTTFHYFERSGSEASVTTPEIDSDGRLSEWPSGFFDQHEENLARLLTAKS